MSCVSHAFASVHCCLVVTCWEWADLLALVGDAYCIFVTFPCGILVQVWYLIVSFPDLCRLSYSKKDTNEKNNNKQTIILITELTISVLILMKLYLGSYSRSDCYVKLYMCEQFSPSSPLFILLCVCL